MKTNKAPAISVCIPVYETEPYLLQCLRSVYEQDFTDFEIVVVSDASRGKDENGRNTKRLVRLAEKECKRYRKINNLPPVKFTFLEHHQNRGILETRRTLVYEACGTYIAMIDSDDLFEPGALSAMYASIALDSTDIVQGSCTAGCFSKDGAFIQSDKNPYSKITIGTLTGHQIFHEWVSDGNITGVLWAKLIKRDLFLKAYENIPYTECNMAEDFMLFFFISQFAKTYLGIQNKVYRYRLFSGVSSSRKIDDLKKWKKVCSAASVFAVIAHWLSENSYNSGNANIVLERSLITPEEENLLRQKTLLFLSNNLFQMKQTVIPELQPQALQMLCEYWGEDFVKKLL